MIFKSVCSCADVLFICCILILIIIIIIGTSTRTLTVTPPSGFAGAASPSRHRRTSGRILQTSNPPDRRSESDPDLQQTLRSTVSYTSLAQRRPKRERRQKAKETRRRVRNGDDSSDANTDSSRDINKIWAKPAHKSLTAASRRSKS